MSANRKRPEGAERSGQQFNLKTAKVLGLFMAVVLAATPGCGTSETARPGHVHIDRNGDGYCDEDGEPISAGAGGSQYYHSGGGYYSMPHYGGSSPTGSPGATPTHSASISSGSHGGIGGLSSGGGG